MLQLCAFIFSHLKKQTFLQHGWIFIFNTPSANDKKTTAWVKLYWDPYGETHQIPGLGWNSAPKCLEDFWWTTPPVFVFCGRCDSLKSPKVFVEQQCLLGDKSCELIQEILDTFRTKLEELEVGRGKLAVRLFDCGTWVCFRHIPTKSLVFWTCWIRLAYCWWFGNPANYLEWC